MKEEWAKRLSEKMSGYTEPAPEAMPVPVRSGVALWWWSVAGLAAAAAVAGIVVWNGPAEQPVTEVAPVLAENVAPVAVVEKEVPLEEAATEPMEEAAKVPSSRLASVDSTNKSWNDDNADGAGVKPWNDVEAEEVTAEKFETETETEDSTNKSWNDGNAGGAGNEPWNDVTPEQQTHTAVAEKPVEEVTLTLTEEWDGLLAEEETPMRKRPQVDLSVFAQVSPFGRMSTMESPKGSSMEYDNAPAPEDGIVMEPTDDTNPGSYIGDEDDDDDDDTKAGMMQMARKAPRKLTDDPFNHRYPLQLGVRVSAGIGSDFRLESGLNYARFLSECGDDEQRLHYVGIPLRLSYPFWNKNQLSLYGSIGGEALKCVAGNGPDKPWLFSADAAVGAQWQLTPLLGLYAETGCGRYFHTGEAQHYFTEHPWAVSLSVGLRFDL